MSYISADLRRFVWARAGGCCEYCRLRQEDVDLSFHIEHIIALSQGGKTDADNLALSCATCNWYKGSNIAAADPETGDPTFLFHPRRHQWDEHFLLEGAVLRSLTSEGRVTVFILRLNNSERIQEREALLSVHRYPCSTEG